ncbi:hypothetical protein E4U53_002693 [Claviceps sorghi]|nr:hypothetical protein E4U53_002693 [Claviceps sorghi]
MDHDTQQGKARRGEAWRGVAWVVRSACCPVLSVKLGERGEQTGGDGAGPRQNFKGPEHRKGA